MCVEPGNAPNVIESRRNGMCFFSHCLRQHAAPPGLKIAEMGRLLFPQG